MRVNSARAFGILTPLEVFERTSFLSTVSSGRLFLNVNMGLAPFSNKFLADYELQPKFHF